MFKNDMLCIESGPYETGRNIGVSIHLKHVPRKDPHPPLRVDLSRTRERRKKGNLSMTDQLFTGKIIFQTE